MVGPLKLVEIVVDDLQHLRDTWADKVGEGSLRRDSAVLRRLLVEGQLARAWRASGRRGEIRIPNQALTASLLPAERSVTVWASDGGARHGGERVAGMRFSAGGDRQVEDLTVHETPLSRFADATTVVAMGLAVSRRDVIKYVANKLGGVHYDEKRKADERVVSALDDVLGVATVNDLPLVYWELLAIGQMLLRSPALGEWLPGGGLPQDEPIPPKSREAGASPIVTMGEGPMPAEMLRFSVDQVLVEELMGKLGRGR